MGFHEIVPLNNLVFWREVVGQYLCEATSIAGFIQQLAVAYITHGYWFYVAGEIPEGKDPAAIDAKLIERYGIAISKWARCRRKKQRLANMQYLRYQQFFVLLATKGRHDFFERERESFRDVRRNPIKFAGYSIGCRKGRDGRWHASVRLDMERYLLLRDGLLDRAMRYDADYFLCKLGWAGHARFAPVRRQLLNILRSVNRVRRTSGLNVIPLTSLPLKRLIVRPYTSGRCDD